MDLNEDRSCRLEIFGSDNFAVTCDLKKKQTLKCVW